MGVQLSTVVPLHNEEGNVQPLYDALIAVLDGLGRTYELVFVDDGSSDGTAAALATLAEADPRVVVITLRRNFGQTGALAAGIDHASGEVLVTLDGDLQHDPRDIPALLAAIDGGADIASGWRQRRTDVDPWLRTLPSRVANSWVRALTGVALRDFGTTFKAYRREIARELELSPDMHRFVPVLAAQRGARIVEVPIASRPRHSGLSHYGIGRMWGVLVDLIVLKFLTSYVARPLRAFAAVGLPLFGLGFLVALAVTVQFYFFTENIGYGNLIFATLCMLMGVQLVGMGLVAELQARTHARVGRSRGYAVRSVVRRGRVEARPRDRRARGRGSATR